MLKSEIQSLLDAANKRIAVLESSKIITVRKGRIEDEVEIARLRAENAMLKAEIKAGPDVED